VKESNRFCLEGTDRHPIRGATEVGLIESDEFVAVSFWLATSSPGLKDEADRMAAKPIRDRAYYSREALQTKYPPDPEGLDAVLAFARRNGLEVLPRGTTESLLHMVVPASEVKDLLGTELKTYRILDGKTYRGRTGKIWLPKEDFAPSARSKIRGVFGLDNRCQADRSQAFAGDSTFSLERSSPLLYGLSDSGKGDGQCIGILEFGGCLTNKDMPAVFGTKNATNASVVVPKPFAAHDTAKFQQESELDAQIVQGFVPNAKKVFYVVPNTEQGWISALQQIVSDTTNSPSVVSISWGYFETEDGTGNLPYWTCSGFEAMEEFLARATLLGITVCCCTGDEGAGGPPPTGPRVYYPASSRYVLSCGGTEPNGATQKVWCSSRGASGGGISNVIPIPPWQNIPAVKVTSNNLGRPACALDGRRIPDVAALANANIINVAPASGTSAAAPLWAALIVMANQQIQATGTSKTVGNLTTLLYDQSSGLQGACTDIVCGTNAIPCWNTACYEATSGWDACTGWGTPQAINFIAALSRSALPVN